MIDQKNVRYTVAFQKNENGNKVAFISYVSTAPLQQPSLHDAVDIKDLDANEHIVGFVTKVQLDVGVKNGTLTQRILAYVE